MDGSAFSGSGRLAETVPFRTGGFFLGPVAPDLPVPADRLRAFVILQVLPDRVTGFLQTRETIIERRNPERSVYQPFFRQDAGSA